MSPPPKRGMSSVQLLSFGGLGGATAAALGLTPDDVPRNSPLYLDPLADIPLILSVGEIETDEFKRHQTELYAAWSAKGLAVEEIPAPDCHHYTIVGHFGDAETALHRAMIDMMR